MNIAIDRLLAHPLRSVGVVSVRGRPFCFAIEDIVRDRDTDGDGDIDAHDVSRFKIHGQTAIPAGRYPIALEDSPRFGPDTITIRGVPGFSYIRMHSGNDETHTEGCPLLGYALTADSRIAFGTTKPAVADLKAEIKAALAQGAAVWLTITNRYEVAA